MNLRTLFLAISVALTFAACGGEPLPSDCTPGACPDGKTECTDAERLPEFCPGQAPELTPAPAPAAK